MWNAPRETIQIDVPRRLFRAVQRRPLGLLVAAFTGVSITFCPLFLYWFGKWGFDITDWRVITNFAVIYLVGNLYMSFGAPVLNLAMKGPGGPSAGTEGGSRRLVAMNALFFLLIIVIGVIIWTVSERFVK